MASQNEIQNYLTIAIRSDEYKINDKFETTTSLTIGSKLDSDSSLHQKRSSTLRKKREKKIINLSQKNSVETAIPAT